MKTCWNHAAVWGHSAQVVPETSQCCPGESARTAVSFETANYGLNQGLFKAIVSVHISHWLQIAQLVFRILYFVKYENVLCNFKALPS